MALILKNVCVCISPAVAEPAGQPRPPSCRQRNNRKFTYNLCHGGACGSVLTSVNFFSQCNLFPRTFWICDHVVLIVVATGDVLQLNSTLVLNVYIQVSLILLVTVSQRHSWHVPLRWHRCWFRVPCLQRRLQSWRVCQTAALWTFVPQWLHRTMAGAGTSHNV